MVGERYILQLLGSLGDPEVGTIVIYGISGIGKTWIAKQACNQAMADHLFDILVWVPLSNTCGIGHAQVKILERLSIPTEDDDSNESIREKIHAFLSGRKFLLVIDDAWFMEEESVLDLIGVPHPNELNGSKVVVTTRTRRTQSVMNPDVSIEPDSLTRTESRDLFFERVGGVVPSQSQLALTVLNRCEAIPLSTILVAGALRDAVDASAALESASLALGTLPLSIYTTMSRAATFAYKMLPSDMVKRCFLYCLLFPGHISIHVRDLIWCWLTDGLLDEDKWWDDETYAKSQAILIVLLDHGMLYREDDDHVRMHDVVREVALDIGRYLGFCCRDLKQQVANPPLVFMGGRPAVVMSVSWQGHERISLMDGTLESLPESPQMFFITSLLLRGNRYLKVIPNPFFRHMGMLTTLDLSFTGIKLLPSSISDLVKLRFLLLKGCKSLEKLQMISSLGNLELLDVSGSTALREIGSESFEHMSLLKVLNLSGTPIEFIPSLSRLSGLRQLLLSGCQCLKILDLEFLNQLELLDLSNSTLVRFPYGLLKLTGLKYLNLAGLNYTTVEGEVMQCLPRSYVAIELLGNDNKVCVSVSSAKFRTLPREHSSLWETDFQRFHLCVSPVEEESMDHTVLFQRKHIIFTESYFKTRHFAHSVKPGRYLEIHSIDRYPVGIEESLNRSELVSFNCVMFMKKLSDMGLGNLRAMRECWIERCNKMECIFSGEEVDVIAAKGCLGNLWISNLESLRFVCGDLDRVMGFDCLQHLYIDCCPNLISLFDSELRLPSLETLQIKFCDRLERVFEDSVLGEDVLPRLHTLRLWVLPEFKSICGGVLPTLKNIKVKECPELKKLPVGVRDICPIVMIKGEKSWWDNLIIEDGIRPYLLFRKWGRF